VCGAHHCPVGHLHVSAPFGVQKLRKFAARHSEELERVRLSTAEAGRQPRHGLVAVLATKDGGAARAVRWPAIVLSPTQLGGRQKQECRQQQPGSRTPHDAPIFYLSAVKANVRLNLVEWRVTLQGQRS